MANITGSGFSTPFLPNSGNPLFDVNSPGFSGSYEISRMDINTPLPIIMQNLSVSLDDATGWTSSSLHITVTGTAVFLTGDLTYSHSSTGTRWDYFSPITATAGHLQVPIHVLDSQVISVTPGVGYYDLAFDTTISASTPTINPPASGAQGALSATQATSSTIRLNTADVELSGITNFLTGVVVHAKAPLALDTPSFGALVSGFGATTASQVDRWTVALTETFPVTPTPNLTQANPDASGVFLVFDNPVNAGTPSFGPAVSGVAVTGVAQISAFEIFLGMTFPSGSSTTVVTVAREASAGLSKKVKLMKFTKLNTPDQLLNRVQDNVDRSLNPVIDVPILDGVLLQSVTLASGSNVINHTLGKTLTGWSIVRQRGVASIYDEQSSNKFPSRTLLLNSSAAVSVDLWVF